MLDYFFDYFTDKVIQFPFLLAEQVNSIVFKTILCWFGLFWFFFLALFSPILILIVIIDSFIDLFTGGIL